MSVPDHQIDPPDSYITVEELNGYLQVSGEEYARRERIPQSVFPIPYHTTFTDQIMEIFYLPFPQEETAYRWWSGGKWDGYNEPDSQEKRTRYYLETYPWWGLWKINKKLEEEKLSPTIDHEKSLIMIGKSKAAAAYIQHNDNFKRFIEELVP